MKKTRDKGREAQGKYVVSYLSHSWRGKDYVIKERGDVRHSKGGTEEVNTRPRAILGPRWGCILRGWGGLHRKGGRIKGLKEGKRGFGPQMQKKRKTD